MLLWLLACSQDDPLSRTELYTRLSLDFRGFRPSTEELQTVERSERNLNKQIDELLQSDQFGHQFAHLMAGVWKTEVVEIDHVDFRYSINNIIPMITSLGQEPLEVLAEIANHDLPYGDFVTADWTMNNEILAEWAPVTYPSDGEGWKRVTYTDGRPAAGVLSSNGLWWRYTSTQGNANRGRANIISKNLLCNDYLLREIAVNRDLNLLDEEAVQDALRNSPSCYACHASLDPLAAHLWGFYSHFRFSPTEQFTYHPERERDWVQYSGVGPGYYGESTETLSDLGQQISNDPRFYECLTQRVMEQLYHRPLTLEDTELKHHHLDVFAQEGYQLRPLIASIARDENYRNRLSDQKRKIVTPQLFASQLEKLTNYRYQYDSNDAIRADVFGLRTLSGGMGEDHSQVRFQTPSPTFSLVIERLSQSAAYHVTHDQEAANQFFTFDFQQPTTNTDQNIANVFHKILSRLPDDTELNLLRSLWNDVYEIDQSSVEAWEITIGFLFRHPDFLTY